MALLISYAKGVPAGWTAVINQGTGISLGKKCPNPKRTGLETPPLPGYAGELPVQSRRTFCA